MRPLLRPRWLVAHLLVLGAVVLFVALGSWQLRRLDERRDRNDLVAARAALPAAPVGDLVDPGDDGDAVRFRRVSAAGDVRASTSVRTTQDGVAGGYLFTALSTADGEAVWVLRGFGAADERGRVREPAPPDAALTVEGVAIPVDRLPRTSRLALERVPVDATGPVLPVVVQASGAPDPLTPVPTPRLDDGPHLSYAVQWFLFAAVATVGYPLLVRSRAARSPDALRSGDDHD